jgi:hypothetical protein
LRESSNLENILAPFSRDYATLRTSEEIFVL